MRKTNKKKIDKIAGLSANSIHRDEMKETVKEIAQEQVAARANQLVKHFEIVLPIDVETMHRLITGYIEKLEEDGFKNPVYIRHSEDGKSIIIEGEEV